MNFEDFHRIRSGDRVFVRARGRALPTVGDQVGTVDHIDGGAYIKLRRSESPNQRAHWVPVTWVDTCGNGILALNRTLEEFERELIDEDPLPR